MGKLERTDSNNFPEGVWFRGFGGGAGRGEGEGDGVWF